MTDKELQEFWEWCGFTQNKQNYGRGSEYLWNYPDAQVGTLPSIDLNNLFKYAVPKVTNELLMPIELLAYPTTGKYDIGFHVHLNGEKRLGANDKKDPAIALYQAIQKARKV